MRARVAAALAACACVWAALAPAAAAILSGGGGGGADDTLCRSPFCDCPFTAWGNVTCRCPAGPAQGEIHLRADGPLRLPAHTTALRVDGCLRVEVHARAVHALRHLRSVELRGAAEVLLHAHAFSWAGDAQGSEEAGEERAGRAGQPAPPPPPPPPQALAPGPRVLVEGARLPAGVPSFAFRGALGEVALRRCSVDAPVAAYAFALDSLRAARLLEISDSRVAAFEAQALKRFAVERLVLSGVTVDAPLPSRAVADVRVRDELRVERVRAPRVRAWALWARGPRSVVVRGCRLGHVEGEALRVEARGPLLLRDNHFGAVDAGAFAALGAEQPAPWAGGAARARLRLDFANNSLAAFGAGALAFNASAVDAHVAALRVALPCDCAAAGGWAAALGVPARELRCLAPQAEGEQAAAAARTGEGAYRPLEEAGCGGARRGASMALLLAAVGAGAAALLLGAAGACVWWRWRRRRRRREGARGPGRRWAPRKGAAAAERKAQAAALVLPARTYRETELHVELERAEPLDKGAPV